MTPIDGSASALLFRPSSYHLRSALTWGGGLDVA
jgi:hypothetical protein